ncbi:hypothetical protein M9Y10_035714 [Tritrichomonas musculus]|uniref:MatE family protein n=1 Tax=Tritrichomonas musculus TaxID=1915356 RepID=A0ABR2GXB7_9EUKA
MSSNLEGISQNDLQYNKNKINPSGKKDEPSSNDSSNNISDEIIIQNKTDKNNSSESGLDDYDQNDTGIKKICCFKINSEADEQERLGAHPALQTLLRQSLGPLCSQVVSSLYSIVDSFWVSHTIGADGLTATGSVSLLEAINNAFGLYLLSCVSSRISYLFGQKRHEECAQVFVDIIRISWIFSIILPIIILNICKPLTKWFGADEYIQEMGFQYMIPVTGLTIFYEMYQICCGLLQSEGLSWIYGVCQVCSLLLNMVCLDPLFLIAIKTPIWGASLASIIASALPMIIIMTLIFKHKFTVKPTFKMFIHKFTPETKSALKLGLSTLIENLSANLPDIVIQKWLGNSGNAIGEYNVVISSWNVTIRIYMFIVCINNGIAQGLLPTASFAFGARRLKRLRNLAFHALWIGTAWNALCEVIVISCPRSLAKIWVKEKKFLDMTEKFFKNGFYCIVLAMFKLVSITTLQSCKKIVISIIQSIFTLLIPIPLFSTILYLTDKKNPPRLLFSFLITDLLAFTITLVVIVVNLRFLFKKDPDNEIDKYFPEANDKNEDESDYVNSSNDLSESKTSYEVPDEV